MAMSYTTLTADKSTEGSIKYYVRHSEVPSASILESAQSWIYSKLRVREMKALTTGTIAASASTITLPTRFVDPISLWLDRDYKGRITILDEEHFEERVSRDADGEPYEGTPTFCTMDQTLAYLDTKADQQYYYRLWHFEKPANLSGSNETPWIVTRYPHLMEAACKFYAYQHREMNEEAQRWLLIADQAITDLNGRYDQYQQSIQHEAYWEQ